MTPNQNEFMVDYYKCQNCGQPAFARKKVCSKCKRAALEPVRSDGRATVLESAEIYYPPDNFQHLAPFTNILARLDDGCKIFGIMEGEVRDVSPGTKVRAFMKDEKTGALIFRPED